MLDSCVIIAKKIGRNQIKTLKDLQRLRMVLTAKGARQTMLKLEMFCEFQLIKSFLMLTEY